MGSDASSSSGPTVSTASTSLGRIVVNSGGRTLYMFGKDKRDKSACAGMCAKFWPPLIAAGKPQATGGARASLLGTTKRADGRMQVTYNRHPLYTFVKDTKKGQTHGEGLTAFGGQWNAVSPAGTKVERQAKAKPKPVQSGIPQNNGGDHDSDNNGGPSDGDGNI
jgi:predicted lipoprotein with Yx(FWY)xxD motif